MEASWRCERHGVCTRRTQRPNREKTAHTQLRRLHKTRPPALQKGQAVGGKDCPGAGMGRRWEPQWAVRCQGRRGGAGGCWDPSGNSEAPGAGEVGLGDAGGFSGQ